MAVLTSIVQAIRRCISLPPSLVSEFLTLKGHYFAAAIAFYAFMSLFPLTIALITFFHLVFGDTFDNVIIENLTEQIPVLAETSGPSFIESFLTDAASKPAVTSSISGLVLFVSAMGVFGALRESVNIVWRLKRRRGFIKQKFTDAILMISAASLMLTSIVVSGLYSFVSELGTLIWEDSEKYSHWFYDVAGIATPFAISFTVLTVIYTWLPYTRVNIKEIVPISLIAAIAFECTKFAFIYYLRNGAERFLTVYGSVATLMMFFIFIYVEAIIVLVGAMLCAKWVGLLKSLRSNRARPVRS